MSFQIGDKVIHRTFGMGEILRIEEMTINGQPVSCYVVGITDMTIWVPVNTEEVNSLRIPTSAEEFLKVLPILTSPNEALVEDRVLRKNQLMDELRDGQLSSICRVVRDLTHYQRGAKLNDQEKTILERAVKSLLTEWSVSLGTTPTQANQALVTMLQS